MTDSWVWDPSLYSGSAAYYPLGRVGYPVELVEALTSEFGLDGTGSLLDVGCGPGSLTLLMADRFEQVVGVDADAGMLVEAARRATAAGIANVEWLCLRAEDLPPDLGPFRLVTLAQSFHWMERDRVAPLLRAALRSDGALAHVHATTHRGVDPDVALPHPRPPWDEIDALVEGFLGSRRRAGQGERAALPAVEPETGSVEAIVYRGAGFSGPTRLELPRRVVTRTADQVVAAVFSLSYAAPHLFGDRTAEFAAALHDLLAARAPDGRFSEQLREIAIDLWRP